MKININTAFWKEENREKHDHTLIKATLFLTLVLIGNTAYGILTKQTLITIINLPPLTLTWLTLTSYTKHKKEQAQEKKTKEATS